AGADYSETAACQIPLYRFPLESADHCFPEKGGTAGRPLSLGETRGDFPSEPTGPEHARPARRSTSAAGRPRKPGCVDGRRGRAILASVDGSCCVIVAFQCRPQGDPRVMQPWERSTATAQPGRGETAATRPVKRASAGASA